MSEFVFTAGSKHILNRCKIYSVWTYKCSHSVTVNSAVTAKLENCHRCIRMLSQSWLYFSSFLFYISRHDLANINGDIKKSLWTENSIPSRNNAPFPLVLCVAAIILISDSSILSPEAHRCSQIILYEDSSYVNLETKVCADKQSECVFVLQILWRHFLILPLRIINTLLTERKYICFALLEKM